MATLLANFTVMISYLYGQANPRAPSQRRECLRVRCISKSAARVMREVEKGGTNGRSAVRKSRYLSRVVQLEVLEELLERDHCELVLPMYESLVEAVWFKWDARLHARILAMVAKREHAATASHALKTQEALTLKQRVELGCALIESYAFQGLQEHALEAFQSVCRLPLPKANLLGYRAMVRAYSLLGNPCEAENTLKAMQAARYRASVNEYKALLSGYGKLRMLKEMERIAREVGEQGLSLDAAGFHMMISAYGQARNCDKMVEVLQRMDDAGVHLTLISWNVLTQACPTLSAVGQEGRGALASPSTLLDRISDERALPHEIAIVKALLFRGVPLVATACSPTSWKLDLHNMSMGTASLVLPMWLSFLRHQFKAGKDAPADVRLVTGWGKHSEADTKAPVRSMILTALEAMKSPFRVDSENKGALVVRGSALKCWLLALSDS